MMSSGPRAVGPTLNWILALGLYSWCFVYGVSAQNDNGYEKKEYETWSMQNTCGRDLYTYGGELQFDSAQLRRGSCTVKIYGIGSNDTMLALHFTGFNVSSGCGASLLLQEPGFEPGSTRNGLQLSYCQQDMSLNSNSIFTTIGSVLIVTYKVKGANPKNARTLADFNVPTPSMRFTMKFNAFTSRYDGCTTNELESQGMAWCQSGRCVHKSLMCKDLNPCGNNLDCSNVTISRPTQTDTQKGMGFGIVMLIIIGVVVALFVVIQVALVARNGLSKDKDLKGSVDFLGPSPSRRPDKRSANKEVEASLFIQSEPIENGHTSRPHRGANGRSKSKHVEV